MKQRKPEEGDTEWDVLQEEEDDEETPTYTHTPLSFNFGKLCQCDSWGLEVAFVVGDSQVHPRLMFNVNVSLVRLL